MFKSSDYTISTGWEHALKIVHCAHPRQWAWKLLVNWWKIWVLATVFWIKAMTMCIRLICNLVLHISTFCLTMNPSCDTSIARCQWVKMALVRVRATDSGFWEKDLVMTMWKWSGVEFQMFAQKFCTVFLMDQTTASLLQRLFNIWTKANHPPLLAPAPLALQILKVILRQSRVSLFQQHCSPWFLW